MRSVLLFTLWWLRKHLSQLNCVVNDTGFLFWHDCFIFSEVKNGWVLPLLGFLYGCHRFNHKFPSSCQNFLCPYSYASINFTFQKMYFRDPADLLQSGLVALYFWHSAVTLGFRHQHHRGRGLSLLFSPTFCFLNPIHCFFLYFTIIGLHAVNSQ